MKKSLPLLMAMLFLLSACGAASTEIPTDVAIPEPAVENMQGETPTQDILGEWFLAKDQSTFDGNSLLDPLGAEIFNAGKLEITGDLFIIGDFGHTYRWIDAQRIRLDGVILSFGSVTEGFFYIFTVQRDGETLRFLLADGSPFMVFTQSALIVQPVSADVAIVAEATTTLPPTVAPLQNIVPTPWTPCTGGYETHLFEGGYAYVNPNPPYPNVVRVEPDGNALASGMLQPGELMEVLDGPQCAGGWVWWNVTSKKTGLNGWTVEGDGSTYWVLPCPMGELECGTP